MQLTATDPDLPANHLTFSKVSGPAALSVSSTGAVSWVTTEADGGRTYDVAVKVEDDGDPVLSETKTFHVIVNEVNSAPTIDPVQDATIDENAAMPTIVLIGHDFDLPAQDLTFAIENAPPTMTVDPQTGRVNWTPAEDEGPGVYHIRAVVTDSGNPPLSASTSFTLTVREVNQPPVLDHIGDRTVRAYQTLTFTAVAHDADLPAQAITFSLDNAPAGATIDPQTGAFSWTPTPAQAGQHTFSVTATDTYGGQASEQITVTVQNISHVVHGASVDLVGKYHAGAASGPDPGIVSVTTDTDDGLGHGQVWEHSGGVDVQEGTFSPFSDAVKRARYERHSFFDVFADFSIDGGDPTRWAPADGPVGAATHGDFFEVGLGQSVKTATNRKGVSITVYTNQEHEFCVALQTEADLPGAVYQSPVGSRQTQFHVTFHCSLDGSTVDADLDILNGAGAGTSVHLGPVAIPQGVNLSDAAFCAGFVSKEDETDAECDLMVMRRVQNDDALWYLARNPYVRPGEPVHFELNMSDLTRAVRSYQWRVDATGPITFTSGSYTPDPFGHPLIDPITADLDFSAEITGGQSPTQDDAKLGDLFMGVTIEGSSELQPRQVTLVDYALQSYVGHGLESNTVVSDGTPPLVGFDVIRNGVSIGDGGVIEGGQIQIHVQRRSQRHRLWPKGAAQDRDSVSRFDGRAASEQGGRRWWLQVPDVHGRWEVLWPRAHPGDGDG